MIRRLTCWLLGHRWVTRPVTLSVWPQHFGYTFRQCERCRMREYHPRSFSPMTLPLHRAPTPELTLQALQDAIERIRREYREGPR